MTYTELKSLIAAYAHRTDLTAKIPDFITLAENVLFREITPRATETSTTGTTSSATITYPADCTAIERIEIVSGGVKYTLSYTSPNGIEALTATTNRPSRFTVENGAIRLISVPSGAYTYTIFYIPRLLPLSDALPTNWLSIQHPDAYLNAAMTECARYTNNDTLLQRYQPLMAASIDAIQREDGRRRFPASGGLQIKPRNAR